MGKTSDSQVDLIEIVREVEELAVFNDEAHHSHDARLAWFKSIQDIHHRMLRAGPSQALQLDVTASPRHDNGAIFAPTVSDYPLAVGFRNDHVRGHGELSTYTPDFIVRDAASSVWIVETQSRKKLDLPQKMAWLKQWCADATTASAADSGSGYDFVYVDQAGFEQHWPQSFAALVTSVREYRNQESP